MQAEAQNRSPHTGCMAVMGREGDTKYSWDKSNPADVAIARRTFNRFREDGYLAFRVDTSDARGEQMTDFDPGAERIVFVPQMQGG